jgi:hypothetical protein
MPLTSLSGPEGEKWIAAAQRADSSLLRALSEHFLAMAAIEEADPRRPDIAKLRDNSTSHFFTMIEHLDASVQAAQEMLTTIPSKGSADLEAMVRSTIQRSIENARNLQRAATEISKQVSSAPGRYPRMASCIDAVSAVQDILATFKQNAKVHQTEGL